MDTIHYSVPLIPGR